MSKQPRTVLLVSVWLVILLLPVLGFAAYSLEDHDPDENNVVELTEDGIVSGFSTSSFSTLAQTIPETAVHTGHPRLFFTAEMVPVLRERVTREPYKSMMAQILRATEEIPLRDDGVTPYDHLSYIYAYQLKNYAAMYLLTGEQQYADGARTKLDLMRTVDEPENRGVWYTVNDRQLSLSQGSLAAAMAYDWCYHAWPEDYRQTISAELLNQAIQQIQNTGPGYPTGGPANNWRGIRYSGAGICILASDEEGALAGLPLVYPELIGYFTANMTTDPRGRGINTEGFGYTQYPWEMIGPFVLALQHMMGLDPAVDVPGIKETIWTCFWPTVALPRLDGRFTEIVYGLHPDMTDDNPNFSKDASNAMALALAPEHYVPGLRWMYDRLTGALGDQDFEINRGGAIWGILYYPEDVPPANPENLWGLGFLDTVNGTTGFRNRYQDEDDLVTWIWARERGKLSQTHFGADINSIRILGGGGVWAVGGGRTSRIGGQSTLMDSTEFFRSDGREERSTSDPGVMLNSFFRRDGSGFFVGEGSATRVTNHVRRMLVDYSPTDASAEALWIISDTSLEGDIWRLNTPAFNSISVNGNQFTITAPNGNQMRGLIHVPASGYNLTTADYDRSGNYSWVDGGYENKYVEIRSDTPSDFLVSLVLVEAGDPIPVVNATAGTGAFQTLDLAGRTYTAAATEFVVPDWALPVAGASLQSQFEAYLDDCGVPAGSRGFDEDFDNDGDTNGYEFGTGRHAGLPDAHERDTTRLESGGMRYFTFKARQGLQYDIEFWEDGTGWVQSDATFDWIIDTENGFGTLLVPADGDRQLARLKVSLPISN